jgi:hypothetical protein
MSINFPASPNFDEVFYDQNSGNSYIFDGNAWVGYSTAVFTVNYNAKSIEIKNDDSILGPSTSINYGTGFNVIFDGTSGISTIVSDQWETTDVGIHTLSNVGIGTTNPTNTLTVGGGTSTRELYVTGVSTLAIGGAGNPEAVYFQSTTEPQASLKISQAAGNDYGVLMTFTSFDGNEATIETDSNSNLTINANGTLNLWSGGDRLLQGQTSCDLFYSNVKKFETTGAGVTVTGTTFTNQLSVSGQSTLNNVNSSGLSTFTSIRLADDAGAGFSTYTTGIGQGYIIGFQTGQGYFQDKYYQFAASGPNFILNSVGIGTTNPTNTLTVGGGTSTRELYVTGVTTFGPGLGGNQGDIDFQHNGETRAYWDGSAGTLNFTDGDGVTFGDSDDVRISWDGTDWLFTKSTSAGSIKFVKSTGSENIAVFSNDGPVELYYNNSKKFETTGAGITVTGTTFTNDLNVSGVSTFNGNLRTNGANIKLGDGNEVTGNQIKLGNGVSSDAFGDSSDLWIYHNPSFGNLFQDITGTGIRFLTNDFRVRHESANADTIITNTTGNNEVRLYQGGNLKFETVGTGVTITGTTFTNQLSVSGVSTFNNTVNAQDIVSTNISANGHITINNTGTELRFQDSGGNPASVRVGDESGGSASDFSNVFLGYRAGYLGQNVNNQQNVFVGAYAGNDLVTSYGNVIIGRFDGITPELDLSYSPTNSGYIVLANGLGDIRLIADPLGNIGIGTTNPTSPLTVKGNTSLETLSVGTGITASTGIVTALDGFSSGIGTGVQITTVGDQLIFTVPGVGSTSFTLYP